MVRVIDLRDRPLPDQTNMQFAESYRFINDTLAAYAKARSYNFKIQGQESVLSSAVSLNNRASVEKVVLKVVPEITGWGYLIYVADSKSDLDSLAEGLATDVERNYKSRIAVIKI